MTAASGQVELVGGPRKADLGSKSSGATADESEQVPRRGHFGKRPDSLVITLLQIIGSRQRQDSHARSTALPSWKALGPLLD